MTAAMEPSPLALAKLPRAVEPLPVAFVRAPKAVEATSSLAPTRLEAVLAGSAWPWWLGDQAHAGSIGLQCSITGEQQQWFDPALGHKQTIKRVAMPLDGVQLCHLQQVLVADR